MGIISRTGCATVFRVNASSVHTGSRSRAWKSRQVCTHSRIAKGQERVNPQGYQTQNIGPRMHTNEKGYGAGSLQLAFCVRQDGLQPVKSRVSRPNARSRTSSEFPARFPWHA